MKINVFNKIVEFDEKNKGINFFLEECCEFPTEDWFKVIHEQRLYSGENLPPVEQLSVSELKKLMLIGVIQAIEDIEDGHSMDLGEEKRYARMALQ